MTTAPRDHRLSDTVQIDLSDRAADKNLSERANLLLTMLYHPDVSRVGEHAVLTDVFRGKRVLLSRNEPVFESTTAAEPQPLGDPHLSRRPLAFVSGSTAHSVSLVRQSVTTSVRVGGQPLGDETELSSVVLEHGVVLLLGEQVVLLLHRSNRVYDVPAGSSLLGSSLAMVRLRREIQRVTDLSVPLLLLGETGTGKELVAREVHRTGPRGHRPFIAVNVAAIPASLAASELFGAERGAFTGATRARAGYFRRAHGGTLFLDEIGETPADVQVQLLRALDNHEVQPVGADAPSEVDVRVIAATDVNLEASSREGRFRAALLHRLSGYEIRVPPLRERRDDIGRLLMHFLREELRSMDGVDRLDAQDPTRPWLPATIVARLAAYDWPGNVRQLRNVARQIVIGNRGAHQARLSPRLERLLQGDAEQSYARERTPRHEYRPPSDVGDEELVTTLRAHRWRLRPAATELGVSRTSLYALIDRCPLLRTASEVGRREIVGAFRKRDGDFDAVVEQLEVSKPALQRRMKKLGLDPRA